MGEKGIVLLSQFYLARRRSSFLFFSSSSFVGWKKKCTKRRNGAVTWWGDVCKRQKKGWWNKLETFGVEIVEIFKARVVKKMFHKAKQSLSKTNQPWFFTQSKHEKSESKFWVKVLSKDTTVSFHLDPLTDFFSLSFMLHKLCRVINKQNIFCFGSFAASRGLTLFQALAFPGPDTKLRATLK